MSLILQSTFNPTWLYIKEHNVTGLKYFGKTTRDPLKYKGSGTHWTRHISKHGARRSAYLSKQLNKNISKEVK